MIPQTRKESHESKFKTMGWGLHKVKISKIEPGEKKNGSPIVDGNGNPSIKVTFRNQKGENIDKLFFYAKDENTECKAEFMLGDFKNALGLGTEGAEDDDVKDKTLWIIVVRTEYYNTSGQQLTIDGEPIVYGEVGAKFFPGTMDYDEVKSKVKGKDPQVDKDVIPKGGDFYYRNTRARASSFKGCDQHTQKQSRPEEDMPPEETEEGDAPAW